IMMIFILVPALAPSIGQFILLFSGWQTIFWFMFAYGACGILWFRYRQYETHPPEKRHAFSLRRIYHRAIEVVKNPVALSFTFASGIIFGSFVAYLNTAPQIMQGLYNLGEMFAVYFGVLAFFYGLSSYLNARFIARFGMEKICFFALSVLTFTSLMFSVYFVLYDTDISLNYFMFFLLITFLSMGPLFGNFNSMAMQPFGHMAGVATSVISSIQTLFAVIVGAVVGQLYDGTVAPLIYSFLVCGIITLLIFSFAHHKAKE
ncbi:MAG: MFS transporter, partial [Emcibacteraceae bacterium]|nr:MFS transporter [Emcibacteraceae bacterium]